MFPLALLIAICFSTGTSLPQSKRNVSSLCDPQEKAAEGEHMPLVVSGIYSQGLDLGPLDDPACLTQSTWVELALKSNHNKEKLRKLLDQSGRAYVVFEGEFYGPPLPDPKLPEAIRKNYHPGWGHLGAFKTKLVVSAIREVKPAPPAQP